MNAEKKTATILQDVKINIKAKLSALWASLLFLYVYVDIFHLQSPGYIEEIMAGEAWSSPQLTLLGAMIFLTIPSVMVFLSLALKSKANRWTNIILGIVYIATSIIIIIQGAMAYYIFGQIVEIVLLLLIVWYAWNWPTQEV
ncbi:MAG: hypothetical protein GY832_03440 [Chloroflexi bacterium]|nr:hypothetical protein [Chloroflexota bacterium]